MAPPLDDSRTEGDASRLEPYWMAVARSYIGVAEIPGPRTAGMIASWLQRLSARWADDETPWCGTYVAAVIDEAGVGVLREGDRARLPAQWARARAWLEWGTPVPLPLLGCIVVLERGPAAGHVGFVAGATSTGRLLVLGGNQGDRVSIAAFPRSRVLGYRWPHSEPLPGFRAALPVGDAAMSTTEA